MNYTRHVEYSDRSEQVLYFGKMEFGFELELELALRTDIDKGLCWLCCMHGIGRVDIRRSTLDLLVMLGILFFRDSHAW